MYAEHWFKQREAILEGKPWGEILSREQMADMDGWDVTILECIRRRIKKNNSIPVSMDLIQSDVHIEMGGLSEEKFQEKFKKLSDMALLRRYVELNI